MKTITKIFLTLLVAASAANADKFLSNGLVQVANPDLENLKYVYTHKDNSCKLSTTYTCNTNTIKNWIKKNECSVYEHKNLKTGYIVLCNIKDKKRASVSAFAANKKDCRWSGAIGKFVLNQTFKNKEVN